MSITFMKTILYKWGQTFPLPFFFDVLGWNSLSSCLTEILWYFMRQKKERRAPGHSRAAPTGRSAWTCRPAVEKKGQLDRGIHTVEWVRHRHADAHTLRHTVEIVTLTHNTNAIPLTFTFVHFCNLAEALIQNDIQLAEHSVDTHTIDQLRLFITASNNTGIFNVKTAFSEIDVFHYNCQAWVQHCSKRSCPLLRQSSNWPTHTVQCSPWYGPR